MSCFGLQITNTHLLRHHKANPKPQYGSKHNAICLDGYSSHANFMDLHNDVTAAWDILIPANIPVVETLYV